jgi:hypothetical protein
MRCVSQNFVSSRWPDLRRNAHLSPSKLAGGSPPDKIIIIDRDVFDQVLELDEDDETFSKDMVDAYFLQAEKTFSDMDAALCAIFSSLPSRSFP